MAQIQHILTTVTGSPANFDPGLSSDK